jgi:hypothetical protein
VAEQFVTLDGRSFRNGYFEGKLRKVYSLALPIVEGDPAYQVIVAELSDYSLRTVVTALIMAGDHRIRLEQFGCQECTETMHCSVLVVPG